ncbi:MAG: DUF3071 domain-containing protein [Propionibacteriaceae bacterium]|nr:DUF3071 domain-containing protein [Propionibacteriaceae bacterium]
MSDQLEIHMESALSPREIQSRIRSGATVAEVAASAGVPVEKVEPFAVPILAEREFVATQARANHVRRGNESMPGTLGEIVTDRLSGRGIDPQTLSWDSYRTEGRKWKVRINYDSGKAPHEALFSYDQTGRFSVADNDEARWLLGLHSLSHGPQPGRRRTEESTIELNPDLALVRVVQSPVETEPEYADEPQPPPRQHLFAIDEEADDDAYTPGVLAEVDGIYDYQPKVASDIDVLYEMLSGLDEDSVKIYTGLLAAQNPQAVQPVAGAPIDFEPPRIAAAPAQPEQPALLDEELPEAEKPRKQRRNRAKVPSWDEIVFGSARKKE